MPFATNRGQRIHYMVEGSGPLVILQHGLLMNVDSWTQNGILAALSEGFRVACVDSLGHGLSDKPSDPELYAQEQRCGDIIAVIEDLGYDRAHLLGYSMGGWLAVGVAKYHPNRLASLVVGGWDLVHGLPPGLNGPLGFAIFMDYANRTAPALAAWVTPQYEPGVRACFEALRQLQGAREAVLSARCPVLIWSGRDDPCHDPMQAFATANELAFLSTAGDHVAAILHPGARAVNDIRTFLHGA